MPAAVAMLLLGHVADEIVVTFDEATRVETVTMTADTLAMLAPIDADGDGELTQADLDARAEALKLGVWEQAKLSPCTRSRERASIEPGFVALTAKYECPPGGELSQEFKWLMVLPSNYRVIFGNQVAKGDSRTVHLTRSPPKAAEPDVQSLVVWGLVGGAIATVVGFGLVRRLRK
ncbi:MAG: hypothetical protein JNK82_04515 [Myxococcaceae bacterium]|nr:hypothetical protein [Myxococcaceae bacterium]